MNNFLKESRKLRHLKNLFVVLGNESCDLDSAVSSICLAFHLNKFPAQLTGVPTKISIIPVLNIPRIELPLKTEVTYFLKENNIDIDNLICKDELPLKDVEHFVLVDHHVSKFKNILLTLDHRPFDVNSNLPADSVKIIEQVGSASTLVTRFIKDTDHFEMNAEYEIVFKLLYGTIIVDTVNFLKEADRARPLDYEMTEYIERALNITDNNLKHRQHLFDKIIQARGDVAALDSFQILLKDFKIISNNNKTVALPGYPILVQEYLEMDDKVEENFLEFTDKFVPDVIIMIGFKVHPDHVERDIGIINIKDEDLFNEIIENLILKTTQFNFVEVANCNFHNGKFYKQLNVKMSRKQILPIVKQILDNK